MDRYQGGVHELWADEGKVGAGPGAGPAPALVPYETRCIITGSEPTPVDRDAAAVMWQAYAEAHPEAGCASPDYTVERFGDSDALADELLACVLDGPKRATAALVDDFRVEDEPLPRLGSHWIACDGSGRPRLVIRSMELRIATFDDVDAAFAYDEGRTTEPSRAGA